MVVPSMLSTAELETLRDAAARTTALARAGRWPHIRTVGKQFPPWPSTAGDGGIWGVQHLLHPDLPDSHVFLASYFSDGVMGVARELAALRRRRRRAGHGAVQHARAAGLGLRVALAPRRHPRGRRFRRRGGPPRRAGLARTVELGAVGRREPRPGARIPRAGPHRGGASGGAVREGSAGQVVVRLRPGDVAFYNNNIFHRGVYRAATERMTLHGSVGHVRGTKARARNVLQHGVGAWVDRCDFSSLPTEQRVRAEGMRERLVRMGHESGHTGYSLED